MRRIFTLLITLLFCASFQAYSNTLCQNTQGNSTAGKLEKHVYKNYLTEKRIEKQLQIGLVRPVDNLPNKKRPLIIGVHGGGFINFCPFEPCFVKQSENVLTKYFTSKGYVTASIEYRLTSPFDFILPKINDEKLLEVQYKATQDVREAIKYIFENADKFGVDTDNVFLIGRSSGAIAVLNAAYLDDNEVPTNLSKKYGQLAKKEKVKGVISLSGAIYDLSYLEGKDKVPMLIIHGNEDFIVPLNKGFYLGMKHLTPVYGGKAIFDEAEKKGIKAQGVFYDFGHDFPSRFVSDIFKNANQFISSNLTCQDKNRMNNPDK
jgi:predicted esterase